MLVVHLIKLCDSGGSRSLRMTHYSLTPLQFHAIHGGLFFTSWATCCCPLPLCLSAQASVTASLVAQRCAQTDVDMACRESQRRTLKSDYTINNLQWAALKEDDDRCLGKPGWLMKLPRLISGKTSTRNDLFAILSAFEEWGLCTFVFLNRASKSF